MTASPTRGTDPLAPVPPGVWFDNEAMAWYREWLAVAERQRGGLPQ